MDLLVLSWHLQCACHACGSSINAPLSIEGVGAVRKYVAEKVWVMQRNKCMCGRLPVIITVIEDKLKDRSEDRHGPILLTIQLKVSIENICSGLGVKRAHCNAISHSLFF